MPEVLLKNETGHTGMLCEGPRLGPELRPPLPRVTGQCLLQLFHESGSRWRTEGLGSPGGGTGGQGPPRAWPDPRAAASQSAARSSWRGPSLGPQNRQESHPSPPGLGPGLGVGG